MSFVGSPQKIMSTKKTEKKHLAPLLGEKTYYSYVGGLEIFGRQHNRFAMYI